MPRKINAQDPVVLTDPEQIAMVRLITLRSALKFEIRFGYPVKPAYAARLMIPVLQREGVVTTPEAHPPYTVARKRAAYRDLDAYIVAHGAASLPLGRFG